MGDGQSQGTSVTYQMVTLTPGLADTLIKDDSPDILQTEIWQFLSLDISAANLSYVDMLNILDYVDIAFCNFLCGIAENDWDKFKIEEVTWAKNPEDPKNPIKVSSKVYVITELWDAIRAKVYIKCCKSRDGFLMRQLTESRSQISQDIRQQQSGFGGYPPQQENKKHWGIL